VTRLPHRIGQITLLPIGRGDCRNAERFKETAAFANRRSVELDAIEPNRLRKLVEDAINRHTSKKLYDKLMKAEKAEQDDIRELVDQIS
jgi:hypothetical protein